MLYIVWNHNTKNANGAESFCRECGPRAVHIERKRESPSPETKGSWSGGVIYKVVFGLIRSLYKYRLSLIIGSLGPAFGCMMVKIR